MGGGEGGVVGTGGSLTTEYAEKHGKGREEKKVALLTLLTVLTD